MDKMKAKIKIIIIALIIVILAGMYSIVDKKNSIYNIKYDNSKFMTLKVDENNSISQRFICNEKTIDGMAMKMGIEDESRKDSIVLKYKLIDVDKDECAAEGDVDLSDLKSGKFFEISFKTVKECKEKEYLFTVSAEKCENNGVVLYYAPGTQEKTEFRYDENVIDGNWVLRTITHRFDLETFIVTLCFVVYIIVFMRWLYKLFK